MSATATNRATDAIQVGDLVMIVRPACCQNEFQGFPFVVKEIGRRVARCLVCGTTHDTLFAFTGSDKQRPKSAPLTSLIKVDPPKMKENEKREEEITA